LTRIGPAYTLGHGFHLSLVLSELGACREPGNVFLRKGEIEMAYTKDGIMAQVWIAFGQGTGAIRVSQNAALELQRWYYDAITDKVVESWGEWSLQVLDRIRAVGSLAALKAIEQGSPTITVLMVYEAALTVQTKSDTPICPPVPPMPVDGE
jgi:hypothetical protein